MEPEAPGSLTPIALQPLPSEVETTEDTQQAMEQYGMPHGVSQGLENLTKMNRLFLCPSRWNESYPDIFNVCNSTRQTLFKAKEVDSDCAGCGTFRGFSMVIENNVGKEVIFMKCMSCRCGMPCGPALLLSVGFACFVPFWCCVLCGDSCLGLVEIHSPPGIVIGYIRQKRTWCSSEFTIQDESKNDILIIRGATLSNILCCRERKKRGEFNISSLNTEAVLGKIIHEKTLQNSSGAKVHDAAYPTEIQFSEDLSVKMKTLILAGGFVFTAWYFQDAQNAAAIPGGRVTITRNE